MEYSIDTKKYINKMISFVKNSSGLNINLQNPVTIQDKLCWLNIYEPMKLKTKCADKILLHDYCKEKLGEDICVPIIKIYNSAKDINFDDLPDKFVIKCNHGSGMNIIVKDKSKLNINSAINKLNKWMLCDFSMKNGFESHYHDIVHKIFVEEYINDGNDTLHDYKFWCFNGTPKMYTINNGNGHGDIMYYKMDGTEWNLYDIPFHPEYKKPKMFDEMVNIAKTLSSPFKFVRVDFYEIENKIYLGELTFTPGAFGFKYKNTINNKIVGDFLTL